MYVRAVAKAVEVHSAQIGESFPRRIEKSAGGRIQPERLGRNSEISGISVIRISMTTMVAQIIKMSGKVSSTLIFNMRVVVNLASPFHRIVYKTPAEYCRRENRDSAPPETESDISPEAPDL